jgi:hypothetical protein
MSGEFDSALRFRNHAEELRIIAADRASVQNRETLLKVAEDYDRIARTFELIDRSKKVHGLPR